VELGKCVSNIRSNKEYADHRPELEAMSFDFVSQFQRKWERVKRAFLAYKSINGDLQMAQRFVIPLNADWDPDLWDMRLGGTVNQIRNGGQYSDHLDELIELGFDFSNQRLF
jgi:hypothetical protein